MAAEGSTLTTLVQALPAELFNFIQELTFTPESGVRHIVKTYTPPVQLQVDHNTREQYAKAYYGNQSIFQIESGLEDKWLSSTATEHCIMLSKIRIERFIEADLQSLAKIRELYAAFKKISAEWERMPPYIRIKLWRSQFQFMVRNRFSEDGVWMSTDDVINLHKRAQQARGS